MWDFLDGIPVVGHVKGIVHYVTGDIEAGNKSMKESTRSSAVLGAGVVGVASGAAVAVTLGIMAGTVWDTMESGATGRSTGIFAGIENIVNKARRGEIPIPEVAQTTLILASDGLGGWSGGRLITSTPQIAKSIGTSVSKSVGKKTGETLLKSVDTSIWTTILRPLRKEAITFIEKIVGNEVAISLIAEEVVIVSTYGRVREIANISEKAMQDTSARNKRKPKKKTKDERSATPGERSSDPADTGVGDGGEEPPRRNPKQTTNSTLQPVQHWQAFLSVFGVQTLDQICIRGQRIFKKMTDYQKKDMKKLIKNLREKGILKKTIETILNIFETVEEEDVTLLNFISLTEFILQYIGEQSARRNQLARDPATSYVDRKREILEIVNVQIHKHDYTIVRVFQEIKAQMKRFRLPVNFRDTFSAVYHYFKHRIVGSHELTVSTYCNLIHNCFLIIKNTPEFINIEQTKEIEFERYYAWYGKRLRVVLKKHGVRVDLSTCYFLNDTYSGDRDGDAYINKRRLPRRQGCVIF